MKYLNPNTFESIFDDQPEAITVIINYLIIRRLKLLKKCTILNLSKSRLKVRKN